MLKLICRPLIYCEFSIFNVINILLFYSYTTSLVFILLLLIDMNTSYSLFFHHDVIMTRRCWCIQESQYLQQWYSGYCEINRLVLVMVGLLRLLLPMWVGIIPNDTLIQQWLHSFQLKRRYGHQQSRRFHKELGLTWTSDKAKGIFTE